jgi:hypothetical protein
MTLTHLENWMNSGNISNGDNPEPSRLQRRKVQRLLENGTPFLITSLSVRHGYREEIVHNCNCRKLLQSKGLRKIFMDEYALPEGQRENLFGIESSEKATEYDLGIGGTGDLQQFDGTIPYDDFKQQYRVSYTHQEWVKGMKIERKLVDRTKSLSTLNLTKSVELLYNLN